MAATLAAGLIWTVDQYWYERPLEPASGERQLPLPDGVTYRLIDQENVGWIQGWRGPGETWRFQRFLRRGDLGIFALADGEVIYYHWVALKLTGHTWARTHDPIEVGDALLHRGHTREDHRHRGVGTYAVAHTMALLREQYRRLGLRRLCVLVRTDNAVPQRLLVRLGCRRTQQIRLVRLLNTWFLYWSRDMPPDTDAEPDSPWRVRIRFKIPEVLWDPRIPILRTMIGQNTHEFP